MSDPRIYSGAEALALKAPATPGRWRRQRRAVLAGDDVVAVFTDERLNSHDPLSDDTNDCGCERGALLDALATLVADADLCAAAPDLAASVAHHEARATGLESLLLTFAADALGAIGRNPLPAGTHPVEAARYAAAQVRLFADDVTEARDNHFARAERAEARLAVAQAIILGGHHADDCPALAHEECAHGGYDPDAPLDDCDAGRTPAECAAARGACDCGVLRAVRAVECATPEALRDGAARAAEAAEATASRDRAWRSVHEARTERDALRAIVEGRTTPPTDEEVAAHEAAGGGWVLCNPAAPLDTRVVCLSAATARVRADFCRRTVTRRWWALDATGRPCGWPPTGDSK